MQRIRSGQKVPVGASSKRKYASPIDKAKAYEVVWSQVSPMFEAARRYSGTVCFVYFIGEVDGPVKIGVSKDPVGRLRNMQTGNPRRLKVEHVLVGGGWTEKLLHELWERYAIVSARSEGKVDAAPGTEWFKPEARETLFPIVETAVSAQIERLNEGGDLTEQETERIIREAHGAHDFVMHKRAEVRLFAVGDGTVLATRPSRI